jgi:hypothetical protein
MLCVYSAAVQAVLVALSMLGTRRNLQHVKHLAACEKWARPQVAWRPLSCGTC